MLIYVTQRRCTTLALLLGSAWVARIGWPREGERISGWLAARISRRLGRSAATDARNLVVLCLSV